MRDIVATIQADQYALITPSRDTPLVVRAAGTGKTASGCTAPRTPLHAPRGARPARRARRRAQPRSSWSTSRTSADAGRGRTSTARGRDLVDGVERDARRADDVAAAQGRRSDGATCSERPWRVCFRGRAARSCVAPARRRFVRVSARRGGRAAGRACGRSTAARRRRASASAWICCARFYGEYGRRLGGGAMRVVRGDRARARARAGLLHRDRRPRWPAITPGPARARAC